MNLVALSPFNSRKVFHMMSTTCSALGGFVLLFKANYITLVKRCQGCRFGKVPFGRLNSVRLREEHPFALGS